MWCPQCQSDVATDFAPDGQSFRCISCGHEIQKVFAPSLHPETQSARDLLEKWAAEQQDHQGADQRRAETKADSTPFRPSQNEQEAKADAAQSPGLAQEGAQHLRLDDAHEETSSPAQHRRRGPRQKKQTRNERRPTRRRTDNQHASTPAPHFDVAPLEELSSPKSGRSEILWGQLLAYSGVGTLTVGTVFVLWGYFGGIEPYASTGWLIATAGQMLLLLGIVTLVGGGMQQTTHEVTERIRHLGGRMIRIEESTEKILRSPHFRRKRPQHRREKTSGSDHTEGAA